MTPNLILLLPAALIMATTVVLAVVLGTTLIRRLTGLPRGQSALLFFVSLAAAVALGIYRFVQVDHMRHDEQVPGGIIMVAASVLLPLVAIPFLVKLYRKWIGGDLTDAEKSPGMEALRAWLRGGNLICALLISLCAWLAFGYSFFGALALSLMALLAYPVLNMASSSFQPVQTTTENLSPERERVLRMLDEGKITAEESAELLNALGSTVHSPATHPAASEPHRKLVFIGLALLLIGFFLPWYTIDIGQEAAQGLQALQDAMNQNGGAHVQLPFHFNNTGAVHYSGGEIRYGLGWLVLLIGIAAAALPYLASNLDRRTQQKAILVGLGVGALILLYLLTEHTRYVSIGIILGMAGYALQILGTLKERQLNARV